MQYQKDKGSLFEQITEESEKGAGTYGLCGGRGMCGKCRVRFLSGAPLPSSADRRVFTPVQLREGYRLACTARPVGSCEVEPCFVREPEAKILTDTQGAAGIALSGKSEKPGRKGLHKPDQSNQGQFCAVDLGTTTVVMQLTDRQSGNVLYTYAFQNPQRMYGIDVLARISAAEEGRADLLQRLIVEGLEKGLREIEQTGRPDEIIISGNTAMEHLLLGYPVHTLGKAPFLPAHTGLSQFTLGGYPAVFLPGISAFVGADIVSGIYALGMTETGAFTLFIDLGTNGEMAIGGRDGILCTAAAAGSAFEGSVSSRIVGTDMTALACDMLQEGHMDESGLLQEPWFTKGYPAGERGELLIRQQDIRNLQMAKAAVCTGVSLLLDQTEGWHRLDRVYLAGGFGYELDVEKAVRIGLIPRVLETRCVAVGNTSLAGAVRFGREGHKEPIQREKHLQHIADISTSLNLAEQPEFEARYFQSMTFAQM